MTSYGDTLEAPLGDEEFQRHQPDNDYGEQNGHISPQNGIMSPQNNNHEPSPMPNEGFMKYNDNPEKNLKPSQINQVNQSQSTNGTITNRSHDSHNQSQRIKYGSEQNYQEAPMLHNGQKSQSLSLEYGKTIRLLRNGDEFYRGHKFVINSRKYRYFDVFMDDISNDLNANFGAIRKIHTPTGGHRIKSLDQMEDGKTYVAAGNSRFVKLK